MAPINEVMVGGQESFLGALSPSISMIVVTNAFSMFATSMLDQTSFHNTTFQLAFRCHLEKTFEICSKLK
jgi:hypothetical protein